MNKKHELQIELGEKLQFNVLLSNYCRIKTGGVADFFFEATTIDELIKVVSVSCSLEIPYIILGGGNDILVSDAGFSGIIIKNRAKNIVFSSSSSEVIVDSGVDLKSLINLSASKDLGGLEFLSSFAGTTGGAIKGNLSDSSYAINDFVKSITLAFRKGNELAIANMPPKKFDFRSKSFGIKGVYDDYPPVVLTVCMQLVHRRKDEILKLISENLKKLEYVQGEEKAIINFFKESGSEFTVDEMLASINAKRQRVGGATVSRRNLNTIVNYKNASAADVRGLAELLKELVNNKLEYTLRERIEYVGQW